MQTSLPNSTEPREREAWKKESSVISRNRFADDAGTSGLMRPGGGREKRSAKCRVSFPAECDAPMGRCQVGLMFVFIYDLFTFVPSVWDTSE